jgi:hypothetical protein
MKTRNGFVSNSSSSSFVVLGAKISQNELETMGWLDEDFCYTHKQPQGISILYIDGFDEHLVGIQLCESEEWGITSAELTLDELKIKESNLQKILNRPIKLFMGTRST